MTTTPDIILPPGMILPPSFTPKDKPDADATPEQKNLAVPRPTGWKLLCMVPPVDEKFENSQIVRADAYSRQEEHATVVLFVMAVGPEAYGDKEKFPNGAWCKQGDFVLVRAYSGTRFKVFGREMRIINDDMVEGVVEDPRGLTRA